MSLVYITLLGFFLSFLLSWYKNSGIKSKILYDTLYTSLLFLTIFYGSISISNRFYAEESLTQAKATIAFDEAAKLAAPKGYQVTEFYAPINIFRTRKIFIKYAVPERPSNFSKYYDEMTAKNYWVKMGTAGQYEKGSLSLEIKPDDEHGTCSVEVTCP